MGPSKAVNEATKREWRDLGFYYERDDAIHCWRLIGSQRGLGRFVQLLDEYVADPRNGRVSEHEHYGPYMYLEFMTWDSARIDDHAIRGSVEDLGQLRELVERRLQSAVPGDVFLIHGQYSQDVTYPLRFEVQDPEFDPASADPNLKENAK